MAQDPLRIEGILRDTCGSCNREIFVLVNTARQKIPADLLAPRHSLPFSLMKGFLVKRLQDELAFSDEAAHWAVETWAFALGLSERDEAGKYEKDNKTRSVGPKSGTCMTDESQISRVGQEQVGQWADDLPTGSLTKRLDAVSGLSHVDGNKAVRILISALDNDLFPVRVAAYDALVARGDPAAPLLEEALDSDDEGIFWRSAILLGALGSRHATEPLARILDRKGKIRVCAIWALGEIGDKAASTPLLKFVNDPDRTVSRETVEALKKIGGTQK
jgi:hypothetical protein